MLEGAGCLKAGQICRRFAKSTYFHLPFRKPGDVSAGLGMPVGGSRLDECTAMRNIHDWLYSIKMDKLEGREVHGYLRERDWVVRGTGREM